jgi:hypothetical protein
MSLTTREEILENWLRLMYRDSDFASAARDCEVSLDDFVQNESENTIADAIKLGLIVADYQNDGWHEGWQRMSKALLKLAEDYLSTLEARYNVLDDVIFAAKFAKTTAPLATRREMKALAAKLATLRPEF